MRWEGNQESRIPGPAFLLWLPRLLGAEVYLQPPLLLYPIGERSSWTSEPITVNAPHPMSSGKRSPLLAPLSLPCFLCLSLEPPFPENALQPQAEGGTLPPSQAPDRLPSPLFLGSSHTVGFVGRPSLACSRLLSPGLGMEQTLNKYLLKLMNQ